MSSNNNPSISSLYRSNAEQLEHLQPLNIVTKEIFSFIQVFGNENDKIKFASEQKLFLQVVIDLFVRLDPYLNQQDKAAAILFVETKDEVDVFVKMAYVIQEHTIIFPVLIRGLALDITNFLSLDSVTDTQGLYEILTNYANELEKVTEELTTRK